jgi:large subunit ribosomal protein L25
MTEVTIIAAEIRERAGKGAARATRRSGRVPGVIYGNKLEPMLIALTPKELDREIHRAGFFARLFDVEIEGTKHRVLARDVQFDVVTDRPLHVDFLRVGAGSTVTVEVPVHFINQDKSPGLRRGGVLNVVRHEVELICNAANIPSEIIVDLSGYDIGTSIHISMINVPEGAKPTITDRDFTVATVAAPTVEVKEPGADEAEPAAS